MNAEQYLKHKQAQRQKREVKMFNYIFIIVLFAVVFIAIAESKTTPDIVFHVEEECFMDNEGERLKMKRLTINDLEKM